MVKDFDLACGDLAEHFLQDEPCRSDPELYEKHRVDLARTIQQTVEDWFLTTETTVTEKQIKHMVDRFLGWKLPSDFSPDAGITFKPLPGPQIPPSGTNLFDASQVDAMVRYMVEGMPD